MSRLRMLVWSALIIPVLAISADDSRPDPWGPVRFLIGKWEGVAEGDPGKGTVTRSYEFVLGNRFIHERNTSTYPPQEKNKKGEVHEHWSMLSYDRARKALVLRQFHTEGFVNQYAWRPTEGGTAKQIIFESEAFENLDSKYSAREIYDVLGPDEFTETFQVAEPGKDFETYSTNHFRRARG